MHREQAGADQVIVAAILGGGAPETIRRGLEAKEAGASAVMVCSPYLSAYNAKDSPEYAFHYHREIAEGLDMPMLLFQLASGDQLSYPHEALVRMAAEIDQVVGVKMAQAADCVRYDRDYYALKSLPKQIACLPSVGSSLLHNLSTGADGILTGLAAFAPYECVELLRLVGAGDLHAARALHARLAPLNHAIYGFPFADLHTRYKEVAYMVGAIASPIVRSPQLRMKPSELDRLWEAAQRAGLRPRPGRRHARPEPGSPASSGGQSACLMPRSATAGSMPTTYLNHHQCAAKGGTNATLHHIDLPNRTSSCRVVINCGRGESHHRRLPGQPAMGIQE